MTIQEILDSHEARILSIGCACGVEFNPPYDRGRPELAHRAHVAEVLDKHMQEREAQAVRYANQSIVDNIDLPDTYIYVDHLTEYANRMEPTNGR